MNINDNSDHMVSFFISQEPRANPEDLVPKRRKKNIRKLGCERERQRKRERAQERMLVKNENGERKKRKINSLNHSFFEHTTRSTFEKRR
jgi:hypothetical protein